MHFSPSFIIAALPFLITAQPLDLKPRTDSSTAYTLTATHDGDQAVHNQPINAANNSFFIGKTQGAICPAGVPSCPAGTDTSIVIVDSFASLNVNVPGGQQLYVSSTGALAYNAPHSRGIPAGATSTGFTTTNTTTNSTAGGSSSSASDDSAAHNLVINGIGSHGWLACPNVVNSNHDMGYQIFANITGVQVSGTSITHCHDIAIALNPEASAGASAFQYS